MKKLVREASIEEVISDVCYYEDIDQSLIINSTEDGGVVVADQEWKVVVTDSTLKSALIRYQVKKWDRFGYTRHQAKELADEFKELDWCAAISKIKTTEGDQAQPS